MPERLAADPPYTCFLLHSYRCTKPKWRKLHRANLNASDPPSSSCYQVLSFFYPWLTYNCTSVLKGWQGNKGKVEGQQALSQELGLGLGLGLGSGLGLGLGCPSTLPLLPCHPLSTLVQLYVSHG